MREWVDKGNIVVIAITPILTLPNKKEKGGVRG